MLPYWILYFLTAIPALKTGGYQLGQRMTWGAYFMALLLILFIGLRYEVGADWSPYELMFEDIALMKFSDALSRTDTAYGFLNWLAHRADADIWLVNLMCAAIFVTGLFVFAFKLPNPWLALAVATPYLVIVVAMGYSRQGVAIGCLMLGLVAISKHSFAKFLFWLIVATAFHRSALVVLPLVGMAYTRNRVLVFAFGAIAAVVAYYVFIVSGLEGMIMNYSENEYESQGAAIRAGMNAIPALLYLANMKRIPIGESAKKMWRNFSIVAISSGPLLFVFDSNTVLDRFSLYAIPLQIFVFAWIPSLYSESAKQNRLIIFLLLAYSAAVQFVWLNFAGHSEFWIPYQIFPQFLPE
ncbi:EpsG family protein [Sphingomonas sp. LY54]|uniref:EpsG family protein n=1 Tax=Sphingomonas sp. LY54 TaxID=3095343 RepID=UPI002D767E98|nr:EpsG family protein [Sphingomonas sp. LY54]WRP27574.1 EpsG family protein [Sphingomonas sp. LY54]